MGVSYDKFLQKPTFFLRRKCREEWVMPDIKGKECKGGWGAISFEHKAEKEVATRVGIIQKQLCRLPGCVAREG